MSDTRNSDNSESSVAIFDRYVHPIIFFEEYEDKVTGYIGRASGVLYLSGRATMVHLNSVRDGKILSRMFEIGRLSPYSEGAEINLENNTFQVSELLTPYGFYTDKSSGASGAVIGISFSANKCVQAELEVPHEKIIKGVDEYPASVYLIDIQNLVPDAVDETKGEIPAKEHGVTSAVAPGGYTTEVTHRR